MKEEEGRALNMGASPDGDRAFAPSASSRQGVSPVSIPSAWRDAAGLEGIEWPVGGYAPGDYMGRCRTCGETVVGVAKRATQCLRCAVMATKRALESVDRALRIRVWNDAKRRGLSDRAAMEEIRSALASASGETRSGSTEGESAAGEAGTPDPCSGDHHVK